jgi:hypothetical protein
MTRQVLKPVLEVVYRIYTDEQYTETRAKEIAMELMEHLSTGIDKTHFINTYNEVKAGIQKKRLERKRQEKILMASAEGAKLKEKRRERKALKKKEKKKEVKLQRELRKK